MSRKNGIYSRKMNVDQPFSVPTFTIPVTSLEDIDTEQELELVTDQETVDSEPVELVTDQETVDPEPVEQETEKVDDTNKVEVIDIVKTENYAERYSFSTCIIF